MPAPRSKPASKTDSTSGSKSGGSSDKHFTLQLPRNSLMIAGAAFAAGLLLFVVVWLANRNSGFYTATSTEPAPQQVAEVEPLPEPLAAAAGSSDMPDARDMPAADTEATLVETAPPPPPAPVADAAPAAEQPAGTVAPGPEPRPLPGQSPPPEYPRAALRSGDQGTVVVRVEVDATGWPSGVALVQRSGSRSLDRAAMQAVRQWRFQPAVHDGTPVPGSIEIPFEFKPGN